MDNLSEPTKRCQVEMSNGKPCGRELHDDKCCIFHSKRESKSVSQFQRDLDQMFGDGPLAICDFTRFVFPEGIVFPKSVQKQVILWKVVFKGDVDLQEVVFQDQADFTDAIFNGKVVFNNSGFKSKAVFAGAIFRDRCDYLGGSFKGPAVFATARFDGAANFASCVFADRCDFLLVRFQKPVSFWQAKFGPGARFTRTEFAGKANFRHAIFAGIVDFVGSRFQEESEFSVTRFESESNFRGCIFKGDTRFQSAHFRREAEFTGCQFEGDTVFRDIVFEDAFTMGSEVSDRNSPRKPVDFRGVKFARPERVEFRKTDLSQFRFLETDLREVRFTDVDWSRPKKKGRNRVFDEIYDDSMIRKRDYCLIAHLYRGLRANFERSLLYPIAGDFYIGEMEMTRKAEENVLKKLPLMFYKIVSEYGESYYRSLCWIAAVLLLFPLLLMFAGIQPVAFDPGAPPSQQISYKLDFGSLESVAPTWHELRDYYTCFLYSMSVFSFIRDKKYTTINNWGHTLFVAESILGPVTLAFFLLALRRRFKR